MGFRTDYEKILSSVYLRIFRTSPSQLKNNQKIMESPYQYADRILPKLFSETNSLVLHYRDLLSKGGFLNTKHIANIKAVYLEEVGDVHSL